MKILFVYPNLMREEYIPLGLASIAAYVKEHDHETFLMDYTWGGTAKDCINMAEKVKPDVVGFSLRSGEFNFSLSIAKELKRRHPNILILFGGIHPTVDPEGTIKQDCVDAIIQGEGEHALVELLNKLKEKKDFSKIKNLWTKKDGKIFRNPVRSLIEDLDKLPFPDRELFGFKRYLDARSGTADIMAGRGCPFQCTYCINHISQKMYKDKGTYTRMRSPENVIKELQELRKKYKINFVAFEDDTFTYSKDWMRRFSKLYVKEIALPCSCNARPETMDDEMAKMLSEMGCTTLNMGIESGNEKIRREVLKRFNTNEQIIKAFQAANNHGLKTYSYNMVGLPYETEKEMWETVHLNRRAKPTVVDASIFQPYPGTELQSLCEKNGWIMDMSTLPFSHKFISIMKYPNVSNKEIKYWKRMFRFRVLRKTNIRKALALLVLDWNYESFIKNRDKIPSFAKAMLYKLWRF
ncbi:MAG: radical SAM protein [Nanoarchaeota archaeon]|nr:radical SAM protein [Nanoarchaeota archaeon]MBU1135663.1 radical SAM protein [Nanoarchaeota archaeon]MBU2520536.1 radical SAM protein [Nanoarchaeota archaeon]